MTRSGAAKVTRRRVAGSSFHHSSFVIHHSSRGYILLELVIAMSIFTVAILGLTRSLNTTLEVGNIMTKEHAVRLGLRSFVEEIKRKAVSDMVTSVKDDRLDATFTSEVNPLTLTVPRSGASIPDVYEMKAKAAYTVAGEAREEVITMWFYQPQVEQDRRKAR